MYKARKFKIAENDCEWLFRDKYAKSPGYIAYRHLIEHALFFLIREDKSKEEIKKKYLRLYEKFNNKEDISETEIGIPLDIYFFKSNQEKAVVVDHTKISDVNTCFPLICDSGQRPYGLKSAVNNIHSKFDGIIETLLENKHKEWDEYLQNLLDKYDDRNAVEKNKAA